jgi:hypothetical protein
MERRCMFFVNQIIIKKDSIINRVRMTLSNFVYQTIVNREMFNYKIGETLTFSTFFNSE